MTAESPLFLIDGGEILGRLAPTDELGRIAERDPSYKNLLNLAISLRVQEAVPENALYFLERASWLIPDRPEAWHNRGLCLTDLGRFSEAAESAQLAWNFSARLGAPYRKSIASGLAYSLMRLGFFAEAWPHWEYGRLNISWRPAPGTEVWDGSPARKVIVIPEGGYGDAFLFRRWLPLLRERCERVKLVLWESLDSWCDWTRLGVDEVELIKPGSGPKFDVASFDPEQVSISWMSLPGILGMKSWEDVPPDPLSRPARTINSRLPRGFLNIGFCWHAEENGSLRRIRSLPSDVAQAVTNELMGHGWVRSLVPMTQHLHLASHRIIPEGVKQSESKLRSWEATTSFVAGLDFIVTVDTAIGHLSGICGTPTLLLVPLCADWKWTSGQHLYGEQLTLFRNNSVQWEPDRIIDAIRERLK